MKGNWIKLIPVVACLTLLAVPAALATYVPTLGVAAGGTGATSAGDARTNLGAAASGSNSDITSLSGLTTALSVLQGGTGATTAGDARSNLGAAASGANSDITSLTGLTTALSVAQGGTGLTTVAEGDILYASGTGVIAGLNHGTEGQVLKTVSGLPAWADASANYTVTPHTEAGTAAVGFNTCDATGGAFALTLPASPTIGDEIVAKKIDVSANAVTVTRAGTQTIDGANTYALGSQYQSVTLVYTAANKWSIE